MRSIGLLSAFLLLVFAGFVAAGLMAGSMEGFFDMVGGGFLTVIGIGFAVYSFHRYEMMRNIPTSTIRSAPRGGPVEISGRAPKEQKHLVTAPTGDTVVFYRYVLEEYQMKGQDGRWVTIGEECSDQYIPVEDGTGRMLIETEDALFELEPDVQKRLRRDDLTPGIRNVLEQYGKEEWGDGESSLLDVVFDSDLRFSQYSVAPGETVYAIGSVEQRTVDGEAWDVLHQDYENLLVLSDRSEKELARKYLLYVGGGILLAAAGIAAALL